MALILFKIKALHPFNINPMRKTTPSLYQANYVLLFFCFISGSNGWSQCSPNFGAASGFSLFTVAGAITNTGVSTINGTIGTNVGAITGFTAPSTVTETTHIGDALTAQASLDLIVAYNQIVAMSPTVTNHAAAFGASEIIIPGVYEIGGAGSIAGDLFLDAQSDPNALFIFKFGGAFTSGASSSVILINGAQAGNVYWIANGAASIAAGTRMVGSLIANGALSMADGCTLHGRFFSITGAISIYNNTVDNQGIEMGQAVGGTVLSNQSICTGTIPADLTLSGSYGTILRWEKSSDIGFSNNTAISCTNPVLSGLQIGALATSTYFRAVLQTSTCGSTSVTSSIASITIASTTWNGSQWSNGEPTSSKGVIISGNYTSTGNLEACTLTVENNATVIISFGDSVTLNGALVVGTGSSFTVESNANLIQISSAENTGVIIVKIPTSPLMRYDYCLWSSPVADIILQSFSPFTLPTRFYTYAPTSDIFVAVPSPATTLFASGTGYLIRMPNNHPTTPTFWNGTFTGTPHNGTFDIPVTSNSYNAVGNPYPSSIDAVNFMTENNISEALYFWRKTNNQDMSSYAVYTIAGGICNIQGDPLQVTPNGDIAVGQGFITKATSNHIVFKNSMRIATNDAPFFRLTGDKSRVWLNLTSTAGFFGQTLIGYLPNATSGIDSAIDGRFFNDAGTALTSIIDTELFSIQGRGLPFESSDAVVLGFKAATAGSFTIAIDHLDGLFTGNQGVYLRDYLTNTVQDLKAGSYTFVSEAGVFNTRFELVYENTLGIHPNTFIADSVILYKEKQELVINSGVTLLEKVEIYDIQGRLLALKNKIKATEVRFFLGNVNEIVVVKITTATNEIIIKKQ